MTDARSTFRVVQWATGRIGATTLAALIDGPEFDLVGVFVHSADKDGRDAGTLIGRAPAGVAATRDIDRIIALKPDCIVAVPEGANVDTVCRFLEAGINVVTSRVDYLNPGQMDQDTRRRVEAACRAGSASIHATGSSPGFATETLPLAATTLCRRVDAITLDEYAYFPGSCPDEQSLAVGFGRPVESAFNEYLLHEISNGFRQSVATVADALGLTLGAFEVFGEMAGAAGDVVLPGGTVIARGTVAAQRVTIRAAIAGRGAITYRVNWYVSTAIDRDWALRENGWRLVVEGDVPTDISVTYPVEAERFSAAMAGLTAFRVVNAVPHTVAAPPGIVLSPALPLTTPYLPA